MSGRLSLVLLGFASPDEIRRVPRDMGEGRGSFAQDGIVDRDGVPNHLTVAPGRLVRQHSCEHDSNHNHSTRVRRDRLSKTPHPLGRPVTYERRT